MSTGRSEVPEPYDELLPVPSLLDWTRDALAPYGFAEHTSLPLVSVCRDELMFGFVDAVTAHWGHCFDLSSLAGLPLMGRTRLGAALGHAPDDDGRHRLVVFAFPHIGADGGLGAVHRPGVPGTTSACGAVDVARNALLAGVSGVVLDPHDVEESLLVQRLRRILGSAPVPTLPEVTELVRAAAVDELALLLAGLSTPQTVVHWALVSGVVVHGHHEDSVSVSSATVVVDGVAKGLTLPVGA
jgi:hypothetical protein